MLNTVVLLLLGWSMLSWESTGAVTITSTSISHNNIRPGAPNTPSAKIGPWKKHLILLVGHLLKHLSDDWSQTLSDDLCSWHRSEILPAEMCSWHISIHRYAFRNVLASGLFHWFCEKLLVISIKYNFGILCTMTNYVMHIPGIFHCKGQAWSRQSIGSGGRHQLSTVGLPGQS